MIYEWERVLGRPYKSLDILYNDFPNGTHVRWKDRETHVEGLGRVAGVCRSLPIRHGEEPDPPALVVITVPRGTTGHVYPQEIIAKCHRDRPG